MSIQLPIRLLPMLPAAAKPVGFVVAVLIGLALYAKHQAENKPKPPQPQKKP